MAAATVAAILLVIVGSRLNSLASSPESQSFPNRAAAFRLRGGHCDGFRSKYAEGEGFFGDFGSDARGMLADKKFPVDTKVKLEATADNNKVVASKTFESPGDIRFQDANTAQTHDVIELNLEKKIGDYVTFASLNDKSQIRAGAKTTHQVGDGDVELKVTTGGSSVTAESKYTNGKVKASLGVGGVTDKSLGDFHSTVSFGGIPNLDRVTVGAEISGNQDGITGHT